MAYIINKANSFACVSFTLASRANTQTLPFALSKLEIKHSRGAFGAVLLT
jgi:hypothetical protein